VADRTDAITAVMSQVLAMLHAEKGTERSERARRLAVTITEMEKVYAYYTHFVVDCTAVREE
jgi:hypothetical protein